MKLLICMNHINSLSFKKDTTLAMIYAANKKGWYCAYFTLKDLFFEESILYANLTAIDIKNLDDISSIELKTLGKTRLSTFDLVLMRQDPPWNMEYLYATYALEFLLKDKVLVANNPQGLRDANEKYFALNFPQYNPATLVTNNIELLVEFWEKHKNVIFKPLSGMAGRGVLQVAEDGKNLRAIIEVLTEQGNVSIMAQKYIPEISITGDKRIIIINGKPIDYALCRMPAKGEVRANLAAGGLGKVVPLTSHDYEICKAIAPLLQAKGLYFVGLDVIGSYITEINVTSPTGIREIDAVTNLDLASIFLEELIVLKSKIT